MDRDKQHAATAVGVIDPLCSQLLWRRFSNVVIEHPQRAGEWESDLEFERIFEWPALPIVITV
jgi:hypothetical protein